MPDGMALALQHPGALAIVSTVFIAGVVYGFAGFGSALIFMPVATIFVEPVIAVAAFQVTAIVSLVTLVPRALREIDRTTVAQLVCAAVLAAPLGIYGLTRWDVTLLRWLVLAIAAVTLIALMSGWRQKARATTPTRLAIGAATGFVGGLTGLLGPIIILFQLSSRDNVQRSRANILVFLTTTSVLLIPLLWLQGGLPAEAVWLGLLFIPAYAIGGLIGQRLFSPAYDVLYRGIAYLIIATAIIAGLPLWD